MGIFFMLFSIDIVDQILTVLLLFTGRKAFGKSWRHVLQNLETKEDRHNNWPCYFWRLVFFSLYDLFDFNSFGMHDNDIMCIMITADPVRRNGNHSEQREKLGLTSSAPKGQSKPRKSLSEPTNAFEKVEVCINLMKINCCLKS